MPTDKDLKRLVRHRMAETGERYTVARTAITGDQVSRAELRRLVAELGRAGSDAERANRAYARLERLAGDQRRAAALTGIDHGNWRVRRRCCRLLDDLSLTDESTTALRRCLADPHPEVRQAALHTLTCEPCKPDGCTADVPDLLRRMADDPNRRVREAVLGPLGWRYTEESWAIDLLERFAISDKSAKLRAYARDALEKRRRRHERDTARRTELPPELAAKTERHAGKWVAIDVGRIVAAGGPEGHVYRVARRMGHPEAVTYWVAPGGAAPAARDLERRNPRE